MQLRRAIASILLPAVLELYGCGGGGSPQSSGPAAPASAPKPASNVSLDKSSYPVFPDKDAGADPSVPPEQGGKGFTGEGWQTNTNYDLIGDPRALKGGVMTQQLSGFPGTLRIIGPEANTTFNAYVIQRLVYEPLLWLHPTTLEFIPALATHWQVSPDKTLYRFRLNPNARWSDGRPVVAEDVVATWSLIMDKTLQAPMEQIIFGKFEKPVAESKYIVHVKAREPGWQSLLYFATQEGMTIFPAHVLKTMTGASYQRDWNYKALPGTGPYTLAESDIAKGRSLSLRRRNDYWGAKERRNIGRGNFDELRFLVVRDENLAFEMFKKGDYDFHYETISRRWIEEMKFEAVERGLIQKRKIYNDNPSGTQGLAFNTRKAPFDDIRLRKAMAHLLDRPKLIKTLFLNEYPPLNSYYAGGIYENPDNPKMPYDPQLALQLLSEAGWKSRDAQGRLVKDGRPLMLELQYSDKNSERWLTVYQDDLRKVGITLNLRLVTPETRFQLQQQRKFDMTYSSWAANTFPSLETEYSSKLADVPDNNNITGIKDKRVDEIIDLYNAEYDQKKREVLIRELDGILTNLHHYVLLWDAPFQRIAFWNRFGYPEYYLSRVDDYASAAWLWWVDPEREAQLAAARRDPAAKLPIPPLESRYWQEYAKREHAASEHSVGSAVK